MNRDLLATSSHDPLTIGQAVDIGTVVNAAIYSQRVARYNEETGNVTSGTARSIGNAYGAFAGPTDDIRDCRLRVTTDQGFEVFWSVAELMEEVRSGYFVAPYHS